MGSTVLGIGASHTTLMNTHWHELKHLDRAERFRDGLANARNALAAVAPDVVVILGSNHFRGFYLDLVPAFTIGVGECIASGEAGTPSGPQRVDTALARYLVASLLDDSFDIAFSAKMQVDHGISHAIQYLLTGLDVPIVPVVINVFAPPLPRLARCAQLGAALRRAIDAFSGRRVAIVASGGLSHQLPWPDWRVPNGADEEFLVEAFLNGRSRWKEYEERRREIVLKASASSDEKFAINTAFDRDFLTQLERGGLAAPGEDLLARAGNGGQEVRTWLTMAAALGHARARVLTYEDIPEWLTGMAVAVLDPALTG